MPIFLMGHTYTLFGGKNVFPYILVKVSWTSFVDVNSNIKVPYSLTFLARLN